MPPFDRRKLILSISTTIIALAIIIYARSIQGDWKYTVLPFILFAGYGYSRSKWEDGYLEKNPEASWRTLARFLRDEPVLNVYCLNVYKWILILFISLIIFSC